jgi:hypothetical protein
MDDETAVAYFKHCPNICMDGLSKTTKPLFVEIVGFRLRTSRLLTSQLRLSGQKVGVTVMM